MFVCTTINKRCHKSAVSPTQPLAGCTSSLRPLRRLVTDLSTRFAARVCYTLITHLYTYYRCALVCPGMTGVLAQLVFLSLIYCQIN